LRFTDFLGQWHHLTIPVSRLSEQSFEDGFGFNGSGLRFWQSASGFDMLLVPQPHTACVDPFSAMSTLSLICAVYDPITREEFVRDPRHVARRAEFYLSSLGIADQAYFGPEVEFFVFDDVQFEQSASEAYYRIDSCEAQWNRGTSEAPNLGHKIRHQQGYTPSPPSDQFMDIRSEMMQTLIDCGVEAHCHYHEVASAGQAEIDIQYSSLVQSADNVMMYKYIVKNVARRHGKTATFMPKPLMGDHGSAMHTHLSLWKGGEPLFAGKSYAGLSDAGLYALGGILKHAPALLAFTNPTTNSFKRLAPDCGAPTNLAYSQRNRSTACRIPMLSPSPKAKRIEFRCPDPSCNPYIAFAAILMAAIDGVQNKIHPGEPYDKDLYDLPPEVNTKVPQTPRSLGAALDALRDDYDFLLRGDVFSEEVIMDWIDYKRKHEVDAIRHRPHPYEFCMYYDV
jgi:glutamine synthetase